jgi:hypothetical protein
MIFNFFQIQKNNKEEEDEEKEKNGDYVGD